MYVDIKQKIIEAPILRNPNLYEVFKVAYDASGVDIGGILSQDSHYVAYFSEKLNGG